jgi:hypothetical protein
MTHQIKRKSKEPAHRSGFHKIISDWKSSNNNSPSKNVDEFYENVMSDAKEYIDAFDKGEMTADDLKDRLDEIAEGYMEDDRSEAPATVYYGKSSDEPEVAIIGHYQNDAEGDFDVKWVSSGGYRGYYDVIPSKKWKLLHSDNILSMSEDSENLKKFDDELQDVMTQKGIKFARVFSRSSNVFSTGLDTFVEAGRSKEVEGIAKNLAKKYRNPADYELTALTGADPSTATKQDRMLVEASHELAKGATPEEAVKKVLKRHG